MKSAEFAISLANQLSFNLTKGAILFCDRSDVKDDFDATMKEALVKVASVAGGTFAKSVEVEIDDLATFEENVSQKSREDRDKADQYALLHFLLYRAGIDSYVEEILEATDYSPRFGRRTRPLTNSQIVTISFGAKSSSTRTRSSEKRRSSRP